MRLKLFFVFIAICCFVDKTFATEEPYLNELKGSQVAVGKSFTVSDEKFNNPVSWALIDQNISVDDIVTFEINFDTTIYFYDQPFNCDLNFKIYIYGNQADTSEITDSTTYANINLIVRYDTVTGKAYKGIAMYKFKNAHKFKVKILGITSAELGTIPAIFRVKGQIIVNRKYIFDDNTTDVLRHSVVNGNQLKLEWTPSLYPGAEMFDLEYTFIDKHSQAGASIQSYYSGGAFYVPADSLAKWFKNNSSRITTAASSYLLNMTYDTGYILFRIRGAQIHYPDDIRWEGNWNYHAREALSSCTMPSCPTGVISFNGHEQGLNWQFSISFAEEGKRKEVVSYFDGSLRNRQSVTINNSDNKSVIAETVYDALGRPAASILPAPTNDSVIKYFPAFNKNSSGIAYSYSDLSFGAECVTVADSLSYLSGTAKYYSVNNPFLTNYYNAKYIPNAQGYPLALTEYTSDNTGRVKSQGGVGPAFQQGAGHETKYYYGKPTQTELDRLFGLEAGNASHYLKNMVQDANGQISVSYLDASGKTVATALAGQTPPNMHSLPSNGVGASVQVSNDLIQPTDFTRNPADQSLRSTATFLAPVTGDYIFNYEMSPLVYQKLYGQDKDSVICSNCYYDLEVVVKDDCENIIRSEIVAAGNVFDTTCATPPSVIEDSIEVSIEKIGEYYVEYILRVSGDALNYYDSVHFVKNTDIKQLNYFLLEELKQADFYGCYSNCETCFDKLGTKPEFIDLFKTLYRADSVSFVAADSVYLAGLYDSLYANCQAIQAQCVPQNACDEKLAILKADVSPGGQYALYDSTYTLLEIPINRLAMRSQIAWFPDEFGNRDSVTLRDIYGEDSIRLDVKQLNDAHFIQYWKSSWADSLVRLHPEYCFYLWCIANAESYEFDRKIAELEDADTAIVRNWFNPSDPVELLDADPFFNGLGNGTSYYNKMRDSLQYFSRTVLGYAQTDKNILQYIDLFLYCSKDSSCFVWDNCSPDNDCRSRNKEWFFYTQLYLNLKQKFYEAARLAHPDFADCQNCFIGKDLVGHLGLEEPCIDTCYNHSFEKLYGSSGNDMLYDTKALPSGGTIGAGLTNSFGSGNYDGYIVKLNKKGNVEWSKTFGGTGYDYFQKITPTRDGGYIAIGTTMSHINIDGDIMVVKLTANGTTSWVKYFGSGDGEIGRDICETDDGGFALCAATTSSLYQAIFVAKIDMFGNVVWSKRHATTNNIEAINILSFGTELIVTGSYYTANYFDGFLMNINESNGNINIIKGYDINGTNNYIHHLRALNNRLYFYSNNSPSIGSLSLLNNTAFTADLNGNIGARQTITGATSRNSVFDVDYSGRLVIGQGENSNANQNIYFLRMDTSGTFTEQYRVPIASGQPLIRSVEKAPGGTAVLSGYLLDASTSTYKSFAVKTSADTAYFACEKVNTTVTVSTPTITVSTLSWTTTDMNIALPDTTFILVNATTTIDTLCDYTPCVPTTCTTPPWTPFEDNTCASECAEGTYDPYDRANISFHIQAGNPYTAPTAPSGYGNCRFYPVFNLHTGPGDEDYCKFMNVWVCTYDTTCGGICPPDDLYPSSCTASGSDTLYRNKERRYPEYVDASTFFDQQGGIPNPQDGSAQGAEMVLQACRDNCDAQADYWMAVLKRCEMNPTDSTNLRATLIDICSKSCTAESMFGASSIPSSVIATYHSFEEAIEGILGPGAINDSCTSELLSRPYPYDKQPLVAERVITEADSAICARLDAFKTDYSTAGFTGSFHQYMEATYGPSYGMDSTSLYDMENACTNCNGLLKNDITLSALLDPLAYECLTCDSVNTALTAFNAKFPALLETDDDYELLFSNFFNHRFGYSLPYATYRAFLDSCDAHSGSFNGQLCNVATTQEVLIDQNSCVKEIYATAMSNAINTYIAYADSVHRDFREAWFTKCMNVQPKLNLTADLYEYHYTLYYYDQSGNLVKTVPPEGVRFLGDSEITQLQGIRNNTSTSCTNNNSMHFGATPSSGGGRIDYTDGTTYPQLSTGSNPFSIEFSIKIESYTDQGIVSTGNVGVTNSEAGFGISIKSNKLNFIICEGPTANRVEAATSLSLATYVPLNTWAHVVVQRTGSGSNGSMRIFINGADIPITYTTNNLTTGNVSMAASSSMYLGAAYKGGGWIGTGLRGNLKHFRIYQRAIDQTEARQNYMDFCGNPSSTQSLVFWESFTGGSLANVGGTDYLYDRVYNAGGALAGTQSFETSVTNTLVPEHRLTTVYQYNSLNQVLQQYSPDADSSWFYYDRLGRLIISQNKEQKENASYIALPGRVSYTKYDNLGRIIEVGEKSGATHPSEINLLDSVAVASWLTEGSDIQITKTIYDIPVNPNWQDFTTSRTRVVASIMMQDLSIEGDSTLYSYDISGNVRTLVQHINQFVEAGGDQKRIDYEYDLVSENVNMLSYQHGKGDQFYYKYHYDAENRVIRSYTSRDKLVWTEDASYNYYLHGPLARRELGQYKVQGVDYAYTLQGWLKGINSDTLDPLYDIAHDGRQNTAFGRVSRDVMTFKLGYFDTDYTAIGGTIANAFTFKTYTSPVSLANTGNQLFNGNISYTNLGLSKINDGAIAGYSYGYDQLNRLTTMKQHTIGGGSTWSNSSIHVDYGESITYDANGNIRSYTRAGSSALPGGYKMDILDYHYNEDGSGNLVNNKLNHVVDAVGDFSYDTDIDNQDWDNYTYNFIGNLKSDAAENISNIDWTVYGKIREITKDLPDESATRAINYTYDATGNRTVKKVTTSFGGPEFPPPPPQEKTTYYVRDAQGNVLAVYITDDEGIKWSEQHLYGSSRLGIWHSEGLVPENPPVAGEEAIEDSLMLGSRTYELSNHLGNVLATISDKKIGNDSSGVVNYYIAEVLSQNDYYPFGMQMPGRSYVAVGSYRYGFNGKENDNEIKGEGNQQDYGMRIYDPRLGRFFSVDPITEDYPELTPYQFSSNRPIDGVDQDGLEFEKWFIRFGVFLTGRVDAEAEKVRNKPNKTTRDNIKLFFNGLARSTPFGMLHQLKKQSDEYKAASPEEKKEIKKQRAQQLLGTLTSAGKDFFSGRAPGTSLLAKDLSEKIRNAANGDVEAMGELTGTTLQSLLPFRFKAPPQTQVRTSILYRGVNESNVSYNSAINGIVKPNGGTATPLVHNTISTLNSPFTSWTTNPQVALNYALRPSGSGVVLKMEIPLFQQVRSPNLKQVNLVQSPGVVVSESEVLVTGQVKGAQVRKVKK